MPIPARACLRCIERKRKCDHRQPQCGFCSRTAGVCQYPMPQQRRGPLGGFSRLAEERAVACENALAFLLGQPAVKASLASLDVQDAAIPHSLEQTLSKESRSAWWNDHPLESISDLLSYPTSNQLTAIVPNHESATGSSDPARQLSNESPAGSALSTASEDLMGDFGYIRQPSVAEASQQALPPCLPYDETPNSPTAAPLLSPNNGSRSLPYINGNCRFPGQQQTYIYGKSPERDVGSAEHFDSFPASHLHGQPVHRDSAACPRPSDTPKLDALAVWSGLLRTPDPQIALNAASREGEAPIGAVEHEVLGFGTTQTRDLVPRGCPTAAAPDLFW